MKGGYEMTPARFPRHTLTGLNLFLAANAVAGAFWLVPTLPREWLAGTPIADYTLWHWVSLSALVR
jgi:hypothetical protein